MPSLDLSGVLIPTVTPFAADGEVDVAAFRANARRWLRDPIRGLVVGGSTGEALLLDEDERILLWEAARDELGDRLLVAGTGAESYRATLRLTRAAAAAGADAVLVQPPAFYRGAMSTDVLEEHFLRLAEDSPVPVIVYQVPLHLGSLDMPNAVTAAVSEHPNVVGIKDSRGKLELLAGLVEDCAEGFQVLVGNGALVFAALEVGAVGGILGVANLLPAPSAEIVQAFRDGDAARAARVQDRVGPAHRGVVGGMGIGGIKQALDWMGMAGGAPRPPLRSLPENRHEELRRILREADLLD